MEEEKRRDVPDRRRRGCVPSRSSPRAVRPGCRDTAQNLGKFRDLSSLGDRQCPISTEGGIKAGRDTCICVHEFTRWRCIQGLSNRTTLRHLQQIEAKRCGDNHSLAYYSLRSRRWASTQSLLQGGGRVGRAFTIDTVSGKWQG